MSRLDSAIRRLQAQRICLNWAVDQIDGEEGIILELGLGNGRSYDHLRKALPGRRIYVFDRNISPHPDCIPPDEDMYLGEMGQMLKAAARDLGPAAILAHADIGYGDPEKSAKNVALIGPLIMPLLRPGAIVISDRALAFPEVEPIALPEGVEEGRYFMQRRL